MSSEPKVELEQAGKLFQWAIYIASPIMMPVSFLMDMFLYWKILWRYYINFGNKSHQQRVAEVQRQVKAWRTEGKGRKMCSARPSWMSISPQSLGYKSTLYKVYVDLHDILEIDTKNMTVWVEPSVTIGFLNRLLVSRGYTLPIVPELDMLTIGGLVMGGGIESTSHKYGLFHHICTQFELVTSDGECVLADLEQNTDLYHAVAMSYGTVGFLTSVKIQIVPYKPYMKITYTPSSSLSNTVKLLDNAAAEESGVDSVEGILYSKETAVVMSGHFVEEHEVEWSKLNRMGLWYKPWFYHHVRTFLDSSEEQVEYVPTLHFHQRHNKPMFWLTHMWLPWAHHPIARFLVGWVLPLNTQVLKFIKEGLIGGNQIADNWIIQDFLMPLSKMKATVEYSDKICPGIFPIWAVPSKLWTKNCPESILPRAGDVMYVDIGVYGVVDEDKFIGRDNTLRKFEQFSLDNDGYAALYAETLMSNEDFKKMFVRTMYDQVRNRIPLCKEAFPDVYEKVSRDGRRGIFKSSEADKKKA